MLQHGRTLSTHIIVEGNKPVTIRQILCEFTYIRHVVRFIKAQSRMVLARGWGEGDGKLVFNRHRVSVLQNESSGDG